VPHGSYGGFTVVGSPTVAADTAIMVDAAFLATSFNPIEIDMADAATMTLATADGVAPTQAGAAAGGGALGTAGQVVPDGGIPIAGGTGASVAGYQAVSTFQTWALGLRIIWPIGYAPTLTGCVQGVTSITWLDPATA
jgi:hypothetical protein